MSKLVIRKRVSFDFLGEEYAEAFVVFKAIAVPEFHTITEEVQKADTKDANKVVLEILKKRYISGEWPNDEGKLEALDGVDELDAFDSDALLECYGRLIGQDLRAALKKQMNEVQAGNPDAPLEVGVDPKSGTESKHGSTTANQPPTKS